MDDPVVVALEQARDLIVKLREELAAERARGSESVPVAVIGTGVRVAGGVGSIDDLWEKVITPGADLITDFPLDRCYEGMDSAADIAQAGPEQARGSFLEDVYDFDHRAFGIGVSEATAMDPQQRILLEVTDDALADAGIRRSDLLGSETGVYVGASTSDYVRLRQVLGGRSDCDPYQIIGEPSFLAGRISFTYGLNGPAEVVDTACSSSLVAVVRALTDLAEGRVSTALAGGVNLVLSSFGYVLLAGSGALSPRGRCSVFDAAADGYVRGEGAGMLVLRRLDDAVDAGDDILAVIRGWGMNHDGRASGITVPSRSAQRAVMTAALQRSGVTADEVMMVEAHGTGTALGDPIEVRSIGDVYGADRTSPIPIRSIKSSIGHTEAAAGIMGVLKGIAVASRKVIPGQAGFSEPNPGADFVSANVEVSPEQRGAPADQSAVGISSFGASGTNAHVVLTGYERICGAGGRRADSNAGISVFVASANREDLVRAQLEATTEVVLRLPQDQARALARGSVSGRDHGRYRAARVLSFHDGDRVPGITVTGQRRNKVRIGFVFPGQGAEYVGMAQELLRRYPEFRAAIERIDDCIDAPPGERVIDLLGESGETALRGTREVQLCLFAVEYGLAELIRSFGITPFAVIGHSVGEFAAAVIAGGISLDDALAVLVRRADAMETIEREGGMVALTGPADIGDRLVSKIDGAVMAAANSPEDTVVAGSHEVLEKVETAAKDAGLTAKRLRSKKAFHSPDMAPVAAELEKLGRSPVETSGPLFVSNISGAGYTEPEAGDGTYWARQVVSPVRFMDCVRSAVNAGVDYFVEVGPGRGLTAMVNKCVDVDAVSTACLLRQGRPLEETLGGGITSLWCVGVEVDLARLAGSGPVLTRGLPGPARDRDRLVPDSFIRQRPDDDSVNMVSCVTWEDVGLPGPAAGGVRDIVVWEPADRPACIVVGGATRVADAADLHSAIGEGGNRPVTIAVVTPDRASSTDLPAYSDVCRHLDSVVDSTERDIRTVLVTRGAEYVDADDTVDPWQAALSAAGRAVAVESRSHAWGVVDLPADGGVPFKLLLSTLEYGPPHGRVALRGEVVRTPVLEEVQRFQGDDLSLRRDGVYLITGGTGALGMKMARWLILSGAGLVVLAGRSGVPANPERRREVEELKETALRADARVEVMAVDVSSRDDLETALEKVRELGPLRGVIHAAAGGEEIPVAEMTSDHWRDVLAAKAHGALYLDELTADDPIEFFVLMSSIAALWGSAQLGGYGAANAVLDALAIRRSASGRPATSVAWGPWNASDGIGDEDTERRLLSMGLRLLEPRQALGQLRHLISGAYPGWGSFAVVDAEWDVLAEVLSLIGVDTMLERMRAEDSDKRTTTSADLAERVEGLSPEHALEVVRDGLTSELGRMLGVAPEEIGADGVSLSDMGLDSIGVSTLAITLTERCGTKISTADLFSIDAAEWDLFLTKKMLAATTQGEVHNG